MIAMPEMLVEPAKQAGIKVPENLVKYNKNDFKHWHVYCTIQLGVSLTTWTEHWENAEIIAKIPDDEIFNVTFKDLMEKGCEF